IDTSIFFPDLEKTYMSRGFLRIIMNARYIELKEHRTLFRALKTLSDEGFSYTLSLIGRGGNLQSELRQHAEDLSIDKNIVWLEPVAPEALREIYLQNDVLVLPSNREAIGMVVPEAMACGLATITSAAVGANVYVQENKTGLIFKTGNI